MLRRIDVDALVTGLGLKVSPIASPRPLLDASPPEAGHAPFFEQAPRFNRELAAFTASGARA